MKIFHWYHNIAKLGQTAYGVGPVQTLQNATSESTLPHIRAQLFKTNDVVYIEWYSNMLKIFAEKMWVAFCTAKATHIFSAQNIRILYIESAKTVNEMTLNELVKLTTLWTTGLSSFRTHQQVIKWSQISGEVW